MENTINLMKAFFYISLAIIVSITIYFHMIYLIAPFFFYGLFGGLYLIDYEEQYHSKP